jgi:ribosome-associated protein
MAMIPEELKNRNIEKEFIFSSSRSSGPGGQNINKLNTKVELRFRVKDSQFLSEGEKDLILKKLAGKISNEGELILTAQSERSQLMNKKVVTEKFYLLVAKALTTPLKRKSTSPTRASVKKRLEEKRLRGFRKNLRKKEDDLSGS